MESRLCVYVGRSGLRNQLADYADSGQTMPVSSLAPRVPANPLHQAVNHVAAQRVATSRLLGGPKLKQFRYKKARDNFK